MSGQNRTGGFPRRHRTQQATIANRQKDCTKAGSLGWVAWSECMQKVLLSGKILLFCSFKNMLDFHVHPQITLCGKNVSSELERERGLAPDYNLQYSEYSCAHCAHIYKQHYFPSMSSYWGWGALYSIFGSFVWGGIVYSGLPWNNNSNHRHPF